MQSLCYLTLRNVVFKVFHKLFTHSLHRPSCMTCPGRRPVALPAGQDRTGLRTDRRINHTLQTIRQGELSSTTNNSINKHAGYNNELTTQEGKGEQYKGHEEQVRTRAGSIPIFQNRYRSDTKHSEYLSILISIRYQHSFFKIRVEFLYLSV